jgi:NitT/TauT family transport system substrate-binding protein
MRGWVKRASYGRGSDRNRRSTGIGLAALASGQVDVAGGASSAAICNSARQGGIHVVADKGSMRKGGGYIRLVVRKGMEATVKTAADLKGHKVAWTGIGVGTTNEPALDHLLKANGFKESDLSLQNLTFGDSLAALASGSVDAAYLIEPLAQAAEQRDIGKIVDPSFVDAAMKQPGPYK